MIYRLPEHINKEVFYHKILPDLTKQYKNIKKGQETAVSLVQTERIDSNALPLFIGMLNLLQNKSGNPVYLELAYNPRFFAFLDAIGFFDKLSRYGIINYEKEVIGGFSDYHYSSKNRIMVYMPFEYYENECVKVTPEIRDILGQNLIFDLFCTPYFKEKTTPIDNDELRDVTLTAVTEFIGNAIIHSGSMSYTYIQSGVAFDKSKKGHILSVVDVGKGFYASLENKIKVGDKYTQEKRNEFYEYAQKIGIDVENEINYLSIMEAIYYSEMQSRKMNLFKLKNLLAISNANLRIHQKNREVVFTSARCFQCKDRSTLHCVECIWKSGKMKNAPIKKYPVAMAGVHIEVEFIQEI